MISDSFASVVAGSVAGSCAVMVAFPFDTVCSKAQVFNNRTMTAASPIPARILVSGGSSSEEVKPLKISGSVLTYDTVDDTDLFDASSDEEAADCIDPELNESSADPSKDMSQSAEERSNVRMVDAFIIIWQSEGLNGFYNGVRVMAIGKALITAVAFTADHVASFDISDFFPSLRGSLLLVALASMFSGFVTSFITTPVERIKVILQAKEGVDGITLNDVDCISRILNRDGGLQCLFLTGLFPTLCREVPSWAFYFVIYQELMQTSLFQWMGALAPLIAGGDCLMSHYYH